MNLTDVMNWIEQGHLGPVEEAFLEAVESRDPPEQMYQVLQALTAGGHDETAATLAGMLLSECVEKLPADEALAVARVVLPAAPAGDELRIATADLYRLACTDPEHIGVFLNACGLEGKCSLRRAMAAMDICLGAGPGSYLVNPHEDDQALRVERIDAPAARFELVTPRGEHVELDPLALADDYQLATDMDFRILKAFRPGEVAELLTADTAGVLTGICAARGGQVDSNALKDLLVPRYVEPSAWSGWWTRARSAVKRSEQLVLEGRNPAVITYHPHGRSLEQELAGRVRAARTPADLYAVAAKYAREAAGRKADIDPDFAGGIVTALADQAREFRARRPADALTASLAVDAVVAMGLPAPAAEYPSAEQAIAGLAEPAASIAALPDAALQRIALEVVERRDDATVQLEALLALMPADTLDDLATRCRAAGCEQGVERAAAQAMADPVGRLQLLLWLWRGPAEPVAGVPGPLELLSRVLAAGEAISRDVTDDRDFRRTAFLQIRAALVAGDCATFRRAADEMNEGSAATIKRRIERSDALSESTRPKLLAILRERFYSLFMEAKVDPWLDETVLWTTEASVSAQQAELKELIEVTMPENSRHIGEAAEKGDLSENSDWQYAVEEQRRLQARAARMKAELTKARVLHAGDVPADTVGIGSRVRLKRIRDGEMFELTFLGPWESDVSTYIYNYETPLARALMGNSVGHIATLKLGGDEEQYEITALACGLS